MPIWGLRLPSSPQTSPALASSKSRELTLTLVNIHKLRDLHVSSNFESFHASSCLSSENMMVHPVRLQRRPTVPRIDNMRQNQDNKRPEILSRLNSALICDCKYLVVTDEAILVPPSFVISRQGQSFAYNNFSFIPPKNNFPRPLCPGKFLNL